MTVIALSAIASFFTAGGGVFCGHVAYDAAKLYRRNRRRSQRIAAELGSVGTGPMP